MAVPSFHGCKVQRPLDDVFRTKFYKHKGRKIATSSWPFIAVLESDQRNEIGENTTCSRKRGACCKEGCYFVQLELMAERLWCRIDKRTTNGATAAIADGLRLYSTLTKIPI